MVKLEMLVDGLPDFGTDHRPVNYAAIAEAAGIHAVRIEQPTEVRAGLEDALAHPGPALVDLVTDPNALSIPPHLTAAEVKGFALAATKVVLEAASAGCWTSPEPTSATSRGRGPSASGGLLRPGGGSPGRSARPAGMGGPAADGRISGGRRRRRPGRAGLRAARKRPRPRRPR
jgi:hypothetical protein